MTRLCLSASARQARVRVLTSRQACAAMLALGVIGGLGSAASAQQPADPAVIADQTTPESAPGRPPRPPTTSSPTDDSIAARARQWAETTHIVERLDGTVDGWYPRLGGMTRGSGLAAGPGYRRHLFEERIRVDVSAAVSTKWYKAVDGHVRWFHLPQTRTELWTDYRYEDFSQQDFYGVGLASVQSARTKYAYSSHDLMARALVRPVASVQVGAAVGYLWPSVGSSRARGFPSIEQLFTDSTAPGLERQPDFRHASVYTDIDTRDERGHPQRGGFYRLSFGAWRDRSPGPYNFNRVDIGGTQYFALTETDRHVIAPHIGISAVNNKSNSRVPFYFLPYVGGVDTIRSFREFRFRDEKALAFGADYLWTPVAHVSLAGFIDSGKVAHTWSDLTLSDLKWGYGIGARFHTSKQMLARIDLATGGGEGVRLFVRAGQSF